MWETFSEQAQVDEWLDDLAAPPRMDWADLTGIVWRAAVLHVGKYLAALSGADPAPLDADAPPGWSDDELLAEALRKYGAAPVVT